LVEVGPTFIGVTIPIPVERGLGTSAGEDRLNCVTGPTVIEEGHAGVTVTGAVSPK
jgi:hypothetical protein